MKLSKREDLVYNVLKESPDGFMSPDQIAAAIWGDNRPKFWAATVNKLMLLLRAKTQTMPLRVAKRRIKGHHVVYFLMAQTLAAEAATEDDG